MNRIRTDVSSSTKMRLIRLAIAKRYGAVLGRHKQDIKDLFPFFNQISICGTDENLVLLFHMSSIDLFQSFAQGQEFFQFGDDALLFGKGRERNNKVMQYDRR